MNFLKLLFAALLCTLFFTGCVRGFIYTDITEPLDRNMRETLLADKLASSANRGISEPVTGTGISVDWASYAVGDAAKKALIDDLRYADIHYISVLGRVYRYREVRVFGKNINEPPQTFALK